MVNFTSDTSALGFDLRGQAFERAKLQDLRDLIDVKIILLNIRLDQSDQLDSYIQLLSRHPLYRKIVKSSKQTWTLQEFEIAIELLQISKELMLRKQISVLAGLDVKKILGFVL